MFKSALKFFAWIFGAVFALMFAIYLIFWIVNLHDQPPSELVQYFESTYNNRIKVSGQNNAFSYLMGLSVAQSEDPKIWGAKRITLIEQASIKQTTDKDIEDLNNNPIMKDYSYKNIRSPSVANLSDSFQLPADEKFYVSLEKNTGVIAEWIDTEAWLMKRYLELLTYHQYQEYVMTDPAAPLPHYAVVMDAQKLFLINVWVQAEQGNSEQVKNLLEQDAVYWRMTLASSDMLISKMIAAAALKRHFFVGNIILKKLSMQTQTNAVPENWKIPFTKAELSMLQTFNGEWIFQDRMFKKIKQKSDAPLHSSFHDGDVNWFDNFVLLFFQTQDLGNKQADDFKKMVDALSISLDNYVDVIKKLDEALKSGNKPHFHIYNVTGEYLRSLSEPESGTYGLYRNYFLRVADLEGIRQAVVLTAEIRNQSIAIDAIPDYIMNSAYHNPYTKKPFEWNPDTQAIKFTGLDEGERGTYVFVF